MKLKLVEAKLQVQSCKIVTLKLANAKVPHESPCPEYPDSKNAATQSELKYFRT